MRAESRRSGEAVGPPCSAAQAPIHGIIGLSYLADGSIVFTTHAGYLYRIHPRRGLPAEVEALGFMHPDGARYVGSLCAIDGERYLAGVARSKRGYEWLIHDLQSGRSSVTALQAPTLQNLLLYGSVTRDDQGRFYLVGRAGRRAIQRGRGVGRHQPVLLRVSLSAADGLWSDG